MAKNYSFATKANRDAFAKVKKSQGFQVRKTILLEIVELLGQEELSAECGADYRPECEEGCLHLYDCKAQLKRIEATKRIKAMILSCPECL